LSPPSDLVVLGGGVMGRFTAYHAAERGARVVILERGRVGDPMTASYGRTRSFRNDYLDTGYALLAHEAFRLWGEFEARTGAEVLVRCGAMNIARRSVTPDFAGTYAEMSHAVLQEAGLETQSLDGDEVRRRFPFLDADLGRLDVDAGVVNLPAVTETLTRVLGERGVQTLEGVETTAVERDGDLLRVITDGGEFVTRSLVDIWLRQSHVHLGHERLRRLEQLFPAHRVQVRSAGLWRYYLFWGDVPSQGANASQ